MHPPKKSMPSPNREKAAQILREVPEQKAFFFYSAEGAPVGIAARSLEDFAAKLEKVDSNVVAFHFSRGDFEKWIAMVLMDETLSRDVAALGKEKLTADELTRRMIKILLARRDALRKVVSGRSSSSSSSKR